MERKLVITIDGPAGAGKSTVSRALAAQLSYLYLDTGALYRAFALKAKKEGVSPDDDEMLSVIGKSINIQLQERDGRLSVVLDHEEVTDIIRTEEISLLASIISSRPCVRQALLFMQREAGVRGGIVAEGRDMGTVVFPDADYKFFLDATITERTKRRYKELAVISDSVNYEQVEADLLTRDKQDSMRAMSPLKPAATAVVVDSTGLTAKEVVNRITSAIINGERQRRG
jgi:cytidylate kinase